RFPIFGHLTIDPVPGPAVEIRIALRLPMAIDADFFPRGVERSLREVPFLSQPLHLGIWLESPDFLHHFVFPFVYLVFHMRSSQLTQAMLRLWTRNEMFEQDIEEPATHRVRVSGVMESTHQQTTVAEARFIEQAVGPHLLDIMVVPEHQHGVDLIEV